MALFAAALDPLLRKLAAILHGYQIGQQKVTCMAYADDVGIFVNNEQEIDEIEPIITTFQNASGARVNPRKTVLLSIGNGSLTINREWYRVTETHKTLGILTKKCPLKMATQNWRTTLHTIRGLARSHSSRHLTLGQKAEFINTAILSKAWYVAQILSAPTEQGSVYYLLWRREIFKVSQAACSLKKEE
ncbi:uncharacterized protein LOC126350939 [Schistocerca gregaria]|uniref:uncharacterized protein LOC126350939 n=1 Tax=Schistocerca gregaria TaxID=7010 RepID=UPI00211E4E3E|nr:uncharacterized protein LOC126350939 [Schistocerca gregaria]